MTIRDAFKHAMLVFTDNLLNQKWCLGNASGGLISTLDANGQLAYPMLTNLPVVLHRWSYIASELESDLQNVVQPV